MSFTPSQHSPSMKPYHILLSLIALLTLTSCEQLGLEVTTIKGKWETSLSDRQYLTLTITNHNTFAAQIYKDSVRTAKTIGKWELTNDTLRLYSLHCESRCLNQFTLEQMTMNTITLRAITGNDPTESINSNPINAITENTIYTKTTNTTNQTYILHRQYTTPEPTYNQKFMEVFYIKQNHWRYVTRCALILTAILIATII